MVEVRLDKEIRTQSWLLAGVLMMDPNWARGFYYDGIPPHSGMKLAREIATVTYRSVAISRASFIPECGGIPS
jgi:homoserine acetyltransferase